LITDDGIVHELELPRPRDDVFEMFIDPEQLIRWIGISAQLDPRPGGTFRFEIQPGQFCEGVYTEVDRPRRLVFTWGWTDPWFKLPPGSTRVEVEFAEAPNGTRLRLVHRRLPDDLRAIHDDGWTVFLDRLCAVTRGDELVPFSVDRPEKRQEELRKKVDAP
jgi:uncharacterized protein YndB with AHSA1/START domain